MLIQEKNQLNKYKVLLVDDELAICDAFKSFTNRMFGFSCVHFGRDAKKSIRENHFDAVVVDYNLPDMCGLELIRFIQATRPTLPTFLITAYSTAEIAAKIFSTGIRDYFKKPFSLGELIAKLEYHLALTKQPNQVAQASDAEEKENQGRFENVMQYVDNRYAEKIALNLAAKIACLSQRHFCRMFKQEFGISFVSYLNKHRIEKAEELLKQSDMSITEIAFSVGFSDLTHFGRRFKQKNNCSALQYRARNSNRKK